MCSPRRRCRRCSRHAPGRNYKPVVGRRAGGSGATSGSTSTCRCPRRFYPGASDRTRGSRRRAGEGARYMSTRPPRPPDRTNNGRAERVSATALRRACRSSPRRARRPRCRRATRQRKARDHGTGRVRDRGGARPPAAVRARGRAMEGALLRARMAARRTRSTPVRLPGDEGGARTRDGPHSSVLASRKMANEVAYWRRTRRRLTTCQAASPPPVPAVRRGQACVRRPRRTEPRPRGSRHVGQLLDGAAFRGREGSRSRSATLHRGRPSGLPRT